ncbi:MAG: O-antigen ligase family protein [Nocardioidaceae bacterium]
MTASADAGPPGNAEGEQAPAVEQGLGWPLRLLYLGFPFWWFLGLANFIFPIMAVPMAVRLARERRLRLPRGFALWALFLVWVLAGVFVLQVDAPGAITGQGGSNRYATFGYRVALYLAATVALLYVGNLSERELPSRRVARLLAYMFVVTTVGGVVGALLPQIEFQSGLETVLPNGLASNAYVQSLIHPRTSEVQTVLGYAESRPVAPFNYANAWGANLSFCLPFFLFAWFGRDAGWRRVVAPFILIAALIPIVYSLNRGLWGALGVALVYVAVRLAVLGRGWALRGLIAGFVIAVLLFLLSPLNAIVQERLAHPHSNERRGQLLSLTVSSALEGSPIIGFGTTRNVQGSFASIAGGQTDACRGCGVPPLGTQGTLWSVTFYQGLVGAALFLSFFAVRFFRHWRSSSPYALIATTVLLMAGTEMFVYDFSGSPLVIIMITLALAWREEERVSPWQRAG